jgi:glutamine amidotransferase
LSKKNIVVVDTGAGNIPSVFRALRAIDSSVSISFEKKEIEAATALVLPGVGAFPKFMENLGSRGLTDVVSHFIKNGGALLGICVGMQALTSGSEEFVYTDGLGAITTMVSNLADLGVRNSRIPHVGWNEVNLSERLDPRHPLRQIANRHVYFMHSYAVPHDAPGQIGWTNHEVDFCSAIQVNNAIGVQFHPEKSHRVGRDFLTAWIMSTECN